MADRTGRVPVYGRTGGIGFAQGIAAMHALQRLVDGGPSVLRTEG